jgi:Glycosyltransferase
MAVLFSVALPIDARHPQHVAQRIGDRHRFAHTQSELPPAARSKSVFIPENAVDPERFAAPFDPARYARLDLCFIGRLVPYKGPDIALEAAQDLLRAGRARLTVIGDGPMMPALREQAARLGVSDAVEFTGWLEHRDVPEVARKSSVFLFPSVREFGGGAVIEAMALGLVPIVVNYGGPGEIVTDDTAFAWQSVRANCSSPMQLPFSANLTKAVTILRALPARGSSESAAFTPGSRKRCS